MKIVVGLSGGVDSAVTAWMLKRQGHEVTGAIMTLWDGAPSADVKRHACYGPDEYLDVEDARKVAADLGIPLHEVDCSRAYRETVLGYFKDEYCAGRTPNPCVICNQKMKFGLLPAMLTQTGIAYEKFATGHYARVNQDPATGSFVLRKGADVRKDQSYFIHRLSREQLSRVLFPLGEFTKEDVRRMAREAAIAVHDKDESQDFYSGELSDLLPQQAGGGDMIDENGKVLGQHTGVWNYTIGQRKGLGVTGPQPLYVTEIDAPNNRVTVGTREALLSRGLIADNVSLLYDTVPARITVKIRSAGPDVPATAAYENGELRVMFDQPQAAVTPGQSAVLYDDDAVVGGGMIRQAVN